MEQFKPKIKLISASAGTGKTYTLIQEISKVLQTTEPSKVVAITFTKAATRDIRSKVHEKFTGSDIKDLDEININTIHGFFTGILREQSIYFKHSTNFNILEQFDDEALFIEIATELLIKKAADPQMEKFFVEYQFEDVLEMLQKLEKRYAVVRDKLDTDPEKLFEEERKAEYKKLKDIIPADVKETVVAPILKFNGADPDKLEGKRKRIVPFIKDLGPVTDLNSFYRMVKVLKELPDDCAPGNSGSAKNGMPMSLKR